MSGNKEPCLGVKGLQGEQNSCTHTHTHSKGERLHITSSSIVDFLVTPPPLLRDIREVWFLDIFTLKNLTINSRKPQAAFYIINSRKP